VASNVHHLVSYTNLRLLDTHAFILFILNFLSFDKDAFLPFVLNWPCQQDSAYTYHTVKNFGGKKLWQIW